MATTKIVLLHTRDPDGGCDITAYDGETGLELVDLTVETIDVDAGRGYELSDWQENIDWATRELPADSPLQRATLEVYGDPPGAKYIEGWERPS